MSVKCVKIEPNNEVDKILYKYFTSPFRKEYIEVGDGKFIMPEHYSTIADEIENFEVKDTDIWLTSHPKTGEYIQFFHKNVMPFILIAILIPFNKESVLFSLKYKRNNQFLSYIIKKTAVVWQV